MTATDFAPPDFAILAAGFAAGLGMLLGATANLTLGRMPALVRAGAAAAACAAAGAAAWLVSGSEPAGWVAAGGAAAGLLVAVVLPGLTTFAAAAARRRSARWGGLAAAGLSVAVGAVAWYDYATEVAADRASLDMMAASERPPTRPAAARFTTDRGTAVAVMEASDPRAQAEMKLMEERFLDNDTIRNRLIRRQPADDRTNCHGWVFTGGRFWLSGTDVDNILADNGYSEVGTPQPGDLVVYRKDGAVAHTAVVRYVTPGMPVLVEGKWGTTGVYLHDVSESVYGTEFTFYHAARASHVLAGLDSAPALAGGQ